MKDQNHHQPTPTRSLSSAANLTSLCVDISPSSSNFFEVRKIFFLLKCILNDKTCNQLSDHLQIIFFSFNYSKYPALTLYIYIIFFHFTIFMKCSKVFLKSMCENTILIYLKTSKHVKRLFCIRFCQKEKNV